MNLLKVLKIYHVLGFPGLFNTHNITLSFDNVQVFNLRLIRKLLMQLNVISYSKTKAN